MNCRPIVTVYFRVYDALLSCCCCVFQGLRCTVELLLLLGAHMNVRIQTLETALIKVRPLVPVANDVVAGHCLHV